MRFQKNKKSRAALSLILGLLFNILPAYSQTPDDLAINTGLQANAREKSLKSAKTPSDSIKILLDVYSLSDKINRDRVRVQIINLAQRSDNNEVIESVLKELSTSTDDTKDLARLIEISESLPEDSARDNLKTILTMEQAQVDAPTATDSMIEKEMADYSRYGMGIGGDPYKEIQNIYRAMTYLGASSQGPLYFEYIKRLEDLVNQLPEEDRAIKNLYYTTAALFYTRKRDYKKAIEFDRKLIAQLDAMQHHYADKEKAKQDLDYFYYISYRRMLRNFKGLTPQQVEEAYQECVRLAGENAQAAEEFGNGGLTNSYYYMATGQYAKAIPELKKALSHKEISDFRKAELLGHLGYAQRMTGDSKGELETMREYVPMLLKDRNARRNDMYKEIELRNSVNKLIADEYMAQEKQRQGNGVMRKTAITLVYVLALLLIFVVQAYFRLRNRVKELEIRNKKLHRDFEYMFDDGTPKGATDLRHKNRLKG
ncbi:MAG: hypothetical protein J1F43_06640 [Muribaculaceae bacterium]|nr:hypothetical protein [Muribaculaceae bacterium]